MSTQRHLDLLDFPIDPLDSVTGHADAEYRRRTISGILESYHGNYDILAEALQNAVDAVEDAKLVGGNGPFRITITIDLDQNTISVLDTGIGMTKQEVARALAPSVSFKATTEIPERRSKAVPYRGYKGVGLTFLAYGTDKVALHSKQHGEYTKARMQYGKSWAEGRKDEPAMLVDDEDPSPLDKMSAGTYVKVQLSDHTRPRQLSKITTDAAAWEVILRTKTAVGQVLLGTEPVAKMAIALEVIYSGNTTTRRIEPDFLFPHRVQRTPPFRFLNLGEYYSSHGEQATPPTEKLRQDGLFFEWDTDKLRAELVQADRDEFEAELDRHRPRLYGFVPYQGSVWGELNEQLTGRKRRNYVYPGLVIAVNGQRLADIFEIDATRFETFSRNIFVLVHLENAPPDQGRKTLQAEASNLAKRAADRAVQYLAKSRALLRPAGEAPSPKQRQVERDHHDWLYNVQNHSRERPLHNPPIAYASEPLTEQDVVGLFHQLAALGVFPGLRIFATSQSQTYDCLVEYDCDTAHEDLAYRSPDHNPLGVSSFVLGDGSTRFKTKPLTLEFKNNLDGLISDLDGTSPKNFSRIDVAVCWSQVSEAFKGYSVEAITEVRIDERSYPGITHLLHRDGSSHVIELILLKDVVNLIQAGNIRLGPGGTLNQGTPLPTRRSKVSRRNR